ncbi:hypothetical protein OGATHE_004254 [Ogataea polymorpha]|uniref:Uncharacterized protein n=1 Tax=Ogataea polymorpha TaxID=460523 RepID=A0A9P8P074_9ASCO|nr:hypothetical protein OGATHE_004254 [Ogataea polymorpha]
MAATTDAVKNASVIGSISTSGRGFNWPTGGPCTVSWEIGLPPTRASISSSHATSWPPFAFKTSVSPLSSHDTVAAFNAVNAVSICSVSSECSRFLILQTPLPRAAMTRALLEMDLEPGGVTTTSCRTFSNGFTRISSTTSALTLIDPKTSLKMWSRIGVRSTVLSGFRFFTTSKKTSVCFSSLANSASSQIAAVLITSAIPLMNSRSGNVSKKEISAKT